MAALFARMINRIATGFDNRSVSSHLRPETTLALHEASIRTASMDEADADTGPNADRDGADALLTPVRDRGAIRSCPPPRDGTILPKGARP